MSYKDLWFAEYERLYNEACDRGTSAALINVDELGEIAMTNVTEQLYDRADVERKRRKEEG